MLGRVARSSIRQWSNLLQLILEFQTPSSVHHNDDLDAKPLVSECSIDLFLSRFSVDLVFSFTTQMVQDLVSYC